jgi:hypothetical protein
MEFDFKITTWERVTVAKEHEEMVLKALKEGMIDTATDIFNMLNDDRTDCTTLLEVNEPMTLQENGGCSTIEVYENGEYIFKNGKE